MHSFQGVFQLFKKVNKQKGAILKIPSDSRNTEAAFQQDG